MEEERASRKRPLPLSDEDDPNKSTTQKRVRFPKGKKVKTAGDEAPGVNVIGPAQGPSPLAAAAPVDLSDPRVAAKERAKRRTQMTTELLVEEDMADIHDITAAEVDYEDNGGFVDDGIQIEPFNLNQEREEGYFDAAGNFVEYANENKIKDAWLDSVDVDSTYTGRNSAIKKIEEDTPDLSSEDIGKMKRRIADLLEPEENVLQALRRLKGTSTDRKEKMPEEVKLMFDQLTEDSMKLMENGEYNVYHDRREVFEREAEGYERLARAKDGASSSVQNGHATMPPLGQGLHPSDLNASSTQNSSGTAAADEFDIFAEDDENPSSNPSVDVSGLCSSSIAASYTQPSSESIHTNLEGGDGETDYVYDESSGYYYSSSLGYYYDPASGFYCSANSGKWYSYNEQSGVYEEVQSAAE